MALRSFVKEPCSQWQGMTLWKVKPEPTRRSRRRPVPAVRTCPRITSDTSSGASPALRSTSRMAAAPSSCAGSDDSPPLKEPARGTQRRRAQHPDPAGEPARPRREHHPNNHGAPAAAPHPRRSWRPTRRPRDPRSWRQRRWVRSSWSKAEQQPRPEPKRSRRQSRPSPAAGRGGRMEPEQRIRRRAPEDSAGAGRAVAWPGRPWGDR